MALEIIGMFGGITGGTQDAIAQIDIPQNGVLRAVDWDMRVELDADLEVADAELSFIATSQLTTNDTRGRISSVSSMVALVTAVGASVSVIQKWVGPFELMVSGGERLFLHVVTTSGVVGAARLNLHFDGGATVTRRSQRR